MKYKERFGFSLDEVELALVGDFALSTNPIHLERISIGEDSETILIQGSRRDMTLVAGVINSAENDVITRIQSAVKNLREDNSDNEREVYGVALVVGENLDFLNGKDPLDIAYYQLIRNHKGQPRLQRLR